MQMDFSEKFRILFLSKMLMVNILYHLNKFR